MVSNAVKHGLEVAAALAGLVAGALWVHASAAGVRTKPRDDGYIGPTADGGMTVPDAKGRPIDLRATMRLQAIRNGRAAWASAAAAALTAIATFL